jgi:non-lysosomal glucosylceramidase
VRAVGPALETNHRPEATTMDDDTRCETGCPCNSGLGRREFLRLTGAQTVALLAAGAPVMADPFGRGDFQFLVPEDKRLSPGWLASLVARGEPTVYRGADLDTIGMPVGGICAGQLYLGGDGRLWHWDIFNRHIGTGAAHYAKPMKPASPVDQGFALTIGGRTVPLDRTGFADVSFRGQYPIAAVEYRDPGVPVAVTLEAFSPFIPLETDDSSLPATVMHLTVRNGSSAPVEATVTGWLENAVLLDHRDAPGTRRNRIVVGDGFTFLDCSAQKPSDSGAPARPDVVFEDWNKDTYAGWRVEGAAFGSGPVPKASIPHYQGDVGGDTDRVANSHASSPGSNSGERDAATGELTSRPFTIDRDFIQFWIGGGSHQGQTCVNLLVDGEVVRTAAGRNSNRMTFRDFDVRPLRGREGVLQIVDAHTGGWGHIGVGRVTFSDRPAALVTFDTLPDLGTMGLALLGRQPADVARARRGATGEDASEPIAANLVGECGRPLRLEPGESATATFVLTWHFPNLEIDGLRERGRYYATKFESARAVARYVAANFDRLASQTRLWRDTWYDSTLPFWFLDRTHLNVSILATSTCYRLASGRFWAWEGVGCCEGTCGHVWQYAHAMARLFPDLERNVRERVEFGLAMQPDGAIHFRGEQNNIPAIDAQAGTVLRALREHRMSADLAFIGRVWPAVKRATQWLIRKDGDGDGLISGNQHNTLDTDWFGPVAWLSGLYLAALEAAAAMADEMNDTPFAATCREIAARGRTNIVAQLFDGEYFVNKPDPQHLDAINSGSGCEIDQVMGQSWAWQVGLPRVFTVKETLSALRSLWKYNFTPDAGLYRERYKAGRWYAMAGEAGLLMCTFPRAGWDYEQAKGKGPDWAAGYFNECMNGFEYQAAGHMVWEGMVQEGLAVTRAVHDRYHAARRNPWNEVECGDHYARSMASYGVFLAACGFEYHGPKGRIGFAPRLSPDRFKAAFTTAEGWGTFAQERSTAGLRAELALKHGSLRLKTLVLAATRPPARVRVVAAGKPVAATNAFAGGRLTVTLSADVRVEAGQSLEVTVG